MTPRPEKSPMIPGRPTYDRSARPTEMEKKKPSRVVGRVRRTSFQPPQGNGAALCVIIETRVRLRAVRLVNKKNK